MMVENYEVYDILEANEVKEVAKDIYASIEPKDLLKFIETSMSRMMGKPVELDFQYLPDGNWLILRKYHERWDKLNISTITDVIYNVETEIRGEDQDGLPEKIYLSIWGHNGTYPLLHLEDGFNRFY